MKKLGQLFAAIAALNIAAADAGTALVGGRLIDGFGHRPLASRRQPTSPGGSRNG